MTPEELKEVDRLIEQMNDEKDETKLSDLIRQFILQRKERRLQQSSEK